jgi:hypothetical protein
MTPWVLAIVFGCLMVIGAVIFFGCLESSFSWINSKYVPEWVKSRFPLVTGLILSPALLFILGAVGMITLGSYTENDKSSEDYDPPNNVLSVTFLAAQHDEQGNFVQSGPWIWCWDNCLDDLPVSMDFQSRVAPITKNPKVRHLSYIVRTRITDPHVYFASVGARDDQGNAHRAAQVVLFQLYEFNDANSKRLAEFHNPADIHQTKELAALLMCEINPNLKSKGMKITRLVSWEVM